MKAAAGRRAGCGLTAGPVGGRWLGPIHCLLCPEPTDGRSVPARRGAGACRVENIPQPLPSPEQGHALLGLGQAGLPEVGVDVRIRAGAASCQGLWNPANLPGVRRREAGMLSERALIFLCSELPFCYPQHLGRAGPWVRLSRSRPTRRRRGSWPDRGPWGSRLSRAAGAPTGAARPRGPV